MKKSIIRGAALLLLISLLISALVSCGWVVKNDIGSDSYSVAYILKDKYDVPEFNTATFATVEACFRAYYYTEIPDNETLAESTFNTFLEYFSETEFESVDEATHALIDCYIYAVGDRYAYYRTAGETEDHTSDMSGSFVGIGVSVLRNELERTITVQGTEPGSPAEAAGMTKDDLIVAVNGERVSEIGTSAAINLIRGEIGTSVEITVDRGGKEITLSMTRAMIIEATVTHSVIADGSIGYIRITSFKGNTSEQFVNAVNEVEAAGVGAIIFDLRGNPGGYLSAVADMLSYLVPTGTKIASFSNSKSDILAYDGTTLEENDHRITVPVAVICNGTSASASELFTGALRDYDDWGLLSATVIGEKTFGKGIMQSEKRFSDGSTLTLTTALYNPPSGINFHGEGVTPDVTLTEADHDLIAEAVRILNENK